MKFVLNSKERLVLRSAMRDHSRADVRRHASWLLALDRGVSVSKLARAAGVTRPTIYRYARAWSDWGAVEALRSTVAGRIGSSAVGTE